MHSAYLIILPIALLALVGWIALFETVAGRCKFCGQQEKDEHCLKYWHCYRCDRTVPYCFGGSTDDYCNDCFHEATIKEKPNG